MRFLILVLAALAAVPAGASAPALMTYQGRVKESGVPANGSRNVDIYICPSALVAVGSCYDTGVQVVSVSNGLFRANFTAPSGNPPTGVDWQSGVQYLQIEVNGLLFSPRELMTSTPYASFASSATTLVPDSGSNAVSIVSNVAIAGSRFTVGGSTFVVRGGNVGVGTSNPGSALEVIGAVKLNGDVTVDGSGHYRATGTGASSPIPGAGCGTGATVAGSDTAGRVTIGSASSTSCTLVFGSQWTANPPVCHFFSESGNMAAVQVSAVDGFSVTFGAGGTPLLTAETFGFLCLGY